jgi:protease IV
MAQFFKIFFASFLAVVVFTGIALLVVLFWIGNMVAASKPDLGSKAVLYINLDQHISEQTKDNLLADFNANEQYDVPGLYDMVRLIHYAKTDSSIKGIYLKCNANGSGMATSNELRNALLDFKASKKFIYAYGDVIPQRAYYIANVADKIYCNPKGGVDWKGLSVQYMFFKQALEKLEIEPQIFYAGKFKSATEPFRADHMTDANRLQTGVFLNDLYSEFLITTAAARHTDTASLHKYANELLIQSAGDAVKYKLVDAVKYDDEVKDEIKKELGIDKNEKINFIMMAKYAKAVNYKSGKSGDRIAVIFAQGDIVDGEGGNGLIGGDAYRGLISNARLDDKIKAIVIRVNSGGGSAMASENIWRELVLARKEKPVVLSFGDYAASGGYYMSCGADSIFTQPNTLTGSIGVFSILPNMKKFFNDKLGITFDGVKTSPYGDMITTSRPLSEQEKKFFQNDIDSIYHTFLTRVSQGRKINIALVDSIAQGRVWTGTRAIQLGLADKIGGLQNAIDCAAGMAKLRQYQVREYPEPQNWLQSLLGNYKRNVKINAIKEELGAEGLSIYSSLKKIRGMAGNSQARMPFDISIQ